MSSFKSKYEVCIAKSQSELESIYRLRYTVFYEENGDSRYAIHPLKQWRDEDDGQNTTSLYIKEPNGYLCGSMRITWLRDHQFIAIEKYDLKLLASVVDLDENSMVMEIARFDRVVVAGPKRGSQVFIHLYQHAVNYARYNSTSILVGAARVNHLRNYKLWRKIGWQPYKEVTSNGITAMLMYLDLRKDADSPVRVETANET